MNSKTVNEPNKLEYFLAQAWAKESGKERKYKVLKNRLEMYGFKFIYPPQFDGHYLRGGL